MRNALIALVAAASLAAAAGPARAGLYLLSYTASTGTLTATIDGMVDPGNSDNVLVTSVTDAKFNGAAGDPIVFVDSVSNFFGGSGAPPVLTFSGDNLDLIAYTASLDGFLFDANGPSSSCRRSAPGPPTATRKSCTSRPITA